MHIIISPLSFLGKMIQAMVILLAVYSCRSVSTEYQMTVVGVVFVLLDGIFFSFFNT